MMESTMRQPELLIVKQGVCYASFAYDVGLSINLDDAERRVTEATERKHIKHKRPAPQYFQFRPAPLRITSEVEPIVVGEFRSRSGVDILLYDFGAVSVTYEIPFEGSLVQLLELSEMLYDNAALLADSRSRLENVVAFIGGTIERPLTAEPVEDYLIFHVRGWDPPFRVSELKELYAYELAQILRSESESLSAQEVRDAFAFHISFGPDDLTVIDWNAALMFGTDMEDVRAVLEFASVELLELRHLDQQLDDALDKAYDLISQRVWRRLWLPGALTASLDRIAQLQVDSALLFERVTNALKLLGDQYLARVYRLASERFHLSSWNENILRKLETIDRIYSKMTERAASRRMEVLEWVIIVLIAVSIIVSFLPPGVHSP
jgi:hypothetical protein